MIIPFEWNKISNLNNCQILNIQILSSVAYQVNLFADIK